MQNSNEHIQYFIYYPKNRDETFPVVTTHDVTNKDFKKVFPEIVGEDPIKRPIFIRDFEKKLAEIKDHSGERNNNYRIHHKISQAELEYLIGEKIN